MRDLLFRGKRKDNGEWVESGSIIRGIPDADPSQYSYYIGSAMSGTWYVNPQGNIVSVKTNDECIAYEVDPDTVGQYTGLTDKNGKRIFEGDIVQATDIHDTYLVGMVVWRCDAWRVCGANWADTLHMANHLHKLTVIGNIHDNNPELLMPQEEWT